MFPVSLIMPVRERAAMREFETAPVPFFAAVHNVASNHGVVAGSLDSGEDGPVCITAE